MADYSKNSKKAGSSTYPAKAIDATSFVRVEPVLNPEEFISRFLWGIPLVSPITRQPLNSHQIEVKIIEAINAIEVDTMLPIFPIKKKERKPFQRDLYQEFVYIEAESKPILSVDKLAVVTSNNETVYEFPEAWIDNANFIDGRVNVVPMSQANGTVSQLSPNAGGGFLILIGLSEYMPAYWQIEYTVGFRTSQGVPVMINRMIGLKAAMMILSTLIPQYQLSSFSLGLDNVNQSQTTQAPQLLKQMFDTYEEEYKALVDSFKMKYNNSMMVGFI